MSSAFRAAATLALIGACAPAAVAQPGVVQAQVPEAAASAAAGAPGARPGSAYRSAFEGYRGHSEQPVGPWRQANDLVRQIGGWKTYAREAHASDAAEAAAPGASMPAGHGGVHKPSTAGTPAPMSPASGNHSGHH